MLQVDPDKAFAVSISHDETVVQGPVAYMQCALLYTSSTGERRIRWVASLQATLHSESSMCCMRARPENLSLRLLLAHML